ncbi:42335_t:CDS:2, partial [Gigaspora margarita]
EATAAYLNKERIFERLKTINKFNRKSSGKTGVFEENEDVKYLEKKFISPIIISPKNSQSSFKPRTFPSIDDISHTEIESILSFGERLTGSPLSFGENFLESDESNLTRASFISQDNETTQEPPVFEVTSSYQERDDEVQSDVSRLSKTSELKQSYNNFWEESKPSVPQMAPDTTTEEIVAENGNALIEVSENFSSFALGEPTKAFNASGSQGDFGLFRERSSVNVSTSAPAFGKLTLFAAATSAPIAFGAGLSASDNASDIPPTFATPPNNVSQSFGQPAFGQPAFGQPAFGQHGFRQARPFGTPAVLSTALKPQSGSGFARNNILGAGGNNFGGANASVNTTKSSFTEF